MTDRAMPAATSLEDIYHTISNACSLSSSYSPTSKHQLSDYMLLMEQHDVDHHNKETDSDWLCRQRAHLQRFSVDGCDIGDCCQQRTHQQINFPKIKSTFLARQQQQQQRQQTNHRNRHQINILNSKRQQQQQQQRQRPREAYQAAEQWMGRNGRRVPLGEPVLFLFHDDDLSTSSAPDTFQCSQQQQQQQPASQFQQLTSQQHHLTIEELRLALNSCWLCGCNWQQDHLSLDCPECGGYALTRPCPSCDGKCDQIWQRNINATHDRHKALWTGQCSFEQETPQQRPSTSTAAALQDLELNSDTDTDDDHEHDHQPLAQQVIAPSSICSSNLSSASSSDCESEQHQTKSHQRHVSSPLFNSGASESGPASADNAK